MQSPTIKSAPVIGVGSKYRLRQEVASEKRKLGGEERNYCSAGLFSNKNTFWLNFCIDKH